MLFELMSESGSEAESTEELLTKELEEATKQLEELLTPEKRSRKMSNVKVGGLTFKVKSKVDRKNAVDKPYYSMAVRMTMDAKDLEEVERSARRGNPIKFSLVSLSKKSEEALEETASIMRLVDDMKARMHRYEINVVFDIQTYDENTPRQAQSLGNLYEDYGTISEEAVAKSNLWWKTGIKEPKATAMLHSLQWSEDYLRNSMTN